MISPEAFEKLLVKVGLLCLAIALLLFIFRKAGLSLGRLPGDIHVSRDGFEFWFPITSGFVVSVCITGILWLWKFISKFF
ncbi:Protein of unknown function (DUF2905) [Mesotoga prima MesG1.Ag.4.2]|uniref:DUF2905 domain-containing protein n=1 Tax=Mesotoga prima MesG1.Ag.4.2 TaxID=660470 RepID=I2F5P5_9BACT|nr:DUF2905 domain-containing protein [Mesotoga prima]AFK07248.1 Protein of unknown function (DUF2905) [Mesotoga prima MesG1.Ag.4.2]